MSVCVCGGGGGPSLRMHRMLLIPECELILCGDTWTAMPQLSRQNSSYVIRRKAHCRPLTNKNYPYSVRSRE